MKHRRTGIVISWLSSILLLVIILNLLMGEQVATPLMAIRAIGGYGEEQLQLIIHSLRAPRLIVAILVGAALAVSGAILQGVIRNPLAAPDVVGITGGASVGAVACITYFPSISVHFLPFAAILGAALAAVLIYSLAWNNGVRPLRLVLVGVGISSLLSAATSFMLVFSPAYSASSSYIWLTGTVYGSTWLHVWILLPWLAVCAISAVMLLRPMNLQLLTDETAIGLGSKVQKYRLLLVAVSVGLAGAAVSVGGVIGFVGLLAPHAARMLTGPVYKRLIPVSALFGAIIVSLADLAGRTLFLPYDIPVGVFTSGIGAPFFIYLLFRSSTNHP